ncbi:MAG: hypothetical protein ABIC95_03440 [archaeon]
MLTQKEKRFLSDIHSYSDKPISFSELTKRTSHVDGLHIDENHRNYDTLAVPIELSDKLFVQRRIAVAAQELYGLPSDTSVKLQGIYEMANCTTNPIRADVTIAGGLEKTFYIKEFNLGRVYGKSLYNILQDGKYLNFTVTDDAVIAEGVPGVLLDDYADQSTTRKKKLDENKLRLELFLHLILLGDIVSNDRNVTVDEANNLHVLDFDQTLKESEYTYFCMDHFDEGPKAYKAIVADESARLARTINREMPRLTQILEALTERNLQQSYAILLGHYNIADVIMQRAEKLVKNGSASK